LPIVSALIPVLSDRKNTGTAPFASSSGPEDVEGPLNGHHGTEPGQGGHLPDQEACVDLSGACNVARGSWLGGEYDPAGGPVACQSTR
jgi:hypothetical protein